jgi:threonine synthase
VSQAPVTVVNSVNPYRIEGQKTGAFEIVDVLGDAPDVHCIPVGNAGNITAYWRGLPASTATGRPLATKLPRMFGFQAAGAAPIVEGHPIEHPETIATAIRIGNPASWYGATAAASESGGAIEAVTDEEILAAYRFLASEEGRCSARRPRRRRWPGFSRWGCRPGSTVVCVLTGNGLKDPDLAISQISVPTPSTRPTTPSWQALGTLTEVAMGLRPQERGF